MTTATAHSAAQASRRIEELGRIIMAYSEVTERLQQSHDRLEQTVRSLREELAEKNRLLQRKNRLAALGEMAAAMAHEIRNPIGAIQLYASLLERDLSDRSASLELVRKIGQGVRRLETLVSQVMQFTREIHVHRAEVDLHAVIVQSLEMACQALARKQIRPCVRGPRPFTVCVDPLLISQALLNLVLNAVDAAPEGGSVEIEYARESACSDRPGFRLLVQDNGPGIPEQILDRIFDPFFTTKETGTGLGLAVVHRIIEAHDGTVTAANRPEGGARFEIRM